MGYSPSPTGPKYYYDVTTVDAVNATWYNVTQAYSGLHYNMHFYMSKIIAFLHYAMCTVLNKVRFGIFTFDAEQFLSKISIHDQYPRSVSKISIQDQYPRSVSKISIQDQYPRSVSKISAIQISTANISYTIARMETVLMQSSRKKQYTFSIFAFEIGPL